MGNAHCSTLSLPKQLLYFIVSTDFCPSPFPNDYFIWWATPSVATSPPPSVSVFESHHPLSLLPSPHDHCIWWATPTVTNSPSPPWLLYLMGNTHCYPSPMITLLENNGSCSNLPLPPTVTSVGKYKSHTLPLPLTVTLFDGQHPLSPLPHDYFIWRATPILAPFPSSTVTLFDR